MNDNLTKAEQTEHPLSSPVLGKIKSSWHAPRLTELKGSNTEANSGLGADGGLLGSMHES